MAAAGRELTPQKILAALEKIRTYEDPVGGPTLSFGPDKHQGSDSIYLSQIIDGKWQVVQKNLPY
jgi:branched-chain amino acid transport system substrate-binding protein